MLILEVAVQALDGLDPEIGVTRPLPRGTARELKEAVELKGADASKPTRVLPYKT